MCADLLCWIWVSASPPGTVQCRTLKGETPLFLAVLHGLRDNATFLLQNGSSPDIQNDEQDSPLVAGQRPRGCRNDCIENTVEHTREPYFPFPNLSHSEWPVRLGHTVDTLQCQSGPSGTTEQDSPTRVRLFRPGELCLLAPGIRRQSKCKWQQTEDSTGTGCTEWTPEHCGDPVGERSVRKASLGVWKWLI